MQHVGHRHSDEIAQLNLTISRLTAERDGARAAAIDECARLLERWRDDAKEFAATNPRNEVMMNVCRNAAVAVRNLATPTVSDADRRGGQ